MKQSHHPIFKVDITQIEGDGDFPCPQCGATISPNDETDTAYRIVDTKARRGNLKGLVILCSNCGSEIHLDGFLQYLQACSCTTSKPVLFWICARSRNRKIKMENAT